MQTERPTDVSTVIDTMPVTALHLVAAGICTLGFVFDLFEMAMGSVLSTVFSSEARAIPSSELSWLIASVYIGAIVGAPLLGWLADQRGRRTMLATALVWLCLTSTWAALSSSTTELTVARVFSGIALGAYPPLMMAYLADILPSGRRGPIVLWACGLGAIGLPSGIFLVRILGEAEPLGLEAWRWAILLGALGSGLTSALVLKLPESPRWLQASGRLEEARLALSRFANARAVFECATPVAATRSTPESGSTDPVWTCIFLLFFFSPFATVAFPVLMGVVLNAKGFQLADALLFVGLSNFGPALASLASSFMIDRFDRRVVLGSCALLMLVAGLAFCAGESRSVLAFAAVAFGIASVLYITTMNLYASELFPTKQRASGTAVAWSLNRLGAVLALLGLVPLLRQEGSLAMFAVVAAGLVVSLALLTLSPKGREQRAVA